MHSLYNKQLKSLPSSSFDRGLPCVVEAVTLTTMIVAYT
jgi:hypothetical protein